MSLLVQDIVKMAEKQLVAAGVDNPKGDAEAMYCSLMRVDRSKFFMEWGEPAADRTCEQYFDMVARRAKREPLQYIVGNQPFLDFNINTKEGVLIPRLDTEVVAEKAIELFKAKKGDTVLDLYEACALTKENAQLNGAKVDVLQGDLFEPIRKKKYHMIISNPPYIRSEVIPTLMPEVKDYEPMTALDGGEDGLMFYRRIVAESVDHLKKGGLLVFEIGNDQAEDVCAMIEETGRFENIEVTQDLAGNDRVVSATFIK